MAAAGTDGTVDDKYYQVAKPGSLAERIVGIARNRIFSDLMRTCRPSPDSTLVDVGVSDVVGDAANVVERLYPHPDRITALGLGTGEHFRAAYPAVTYHQIIANQPLPFPDRAFDIATSNAVLEHVGSIENQRVFVSELCRVAERVFITVPNRGFPVEHHTGIPFLHWTEFTFAMSARMLGKDEWTKSENLIMMSRHHLQSLCPPGRHPTVGYTGIMLGPFSGNLFLYVAEEDRRPNGRGVSEASRP